MTTTKGGRRRRRQLSSGYMVLKSGRAVPKRAGRKSYSLHGIISLTVSFRHNLSLSGSFLAYLKSFVFLKKNINASTVYNPAHLFRGPWEEERASATAERRWGRKGARKRSRKLEKKRCSTLIPPAFLLYIARSQPRILKAKSVLSLSARMSRFRN